MRLRNTIIVLVLAAIVGGYAYLVHRGKANEKTRTLFDVKPEDIVRVDLKYPDREILLQRKDKKRWEITRPIHVDADQTEADNLARAVAECELKRTVEEGPTDLARFGLAKPAVTVTISTGKKTYAAIQVGKLTPIGFSAYMKTSDKPAVMLTSSAFQSAMNKTVESLRNRDIMAFKLDDVTKFTLQRNTGPLLEVDREGDNWTIVKPAKYKGDPTNCRELLSALVNAKVADFIADAPSSVAQFGLEKPALAATVYLKGAGPQSLLFGAKPGEPGKDAIYVRRGEGKSVFTVNETVMNDVNKSVLDLRDKTVLGFEPAKVKRLKILGPLGSYVLARAGGTWEVADGVKGRAEAAVVERFIDQLRDLKGESIVADPMKVPRLFGMNEPAEIIALVGQDEREIGKIMLAKVAVKPFGPGGPEPGGGSIYYAASSASSAVYKIDDFTYGQLYKTAEQFLTKSATPAAAPGLKQ